MGKKLTVNINEELDEKFREAIFKRKGMKKGNLTESIEEAMLLWINSSNHDKVTKTTRLDNNAKR